MLAGFGEDTGKSPDELVKLSPETCYERALWKWAVGKSRIGTLSTCRLRAIWYAVKDFLNFHKIDVGRKPCLSMAQSIWIRYRLGKS
jgi:hypothetical protein